MASAEADAKAACFRKDGSRRDADWCENFARNSDDCFKMGIAVSRRSTKLYSDFVLQYPRSPFTRTAKLRLKTIDREIAAVMGAQGGNRPIYTRPNEAAAGSGDPARPEVPLADDPSTED